MDEEKAKGLNTKTNFYILILALVICSVVYRLLGKYDYNHTSFLFVGIPALLAILLVKYTDSPRTAYGIVFKAITLFLLLSAILLGEGTVCILFAAPIFYAIAALIVAIYEYFKNKGKSDLSAFVIIPVVLVMAQPSQINNVPDMQSKETIVIIDNAVSISAFNKTPDFLSNYPSFFKIGFPQPMGIEGEGLNIGDKRNITFQSSTKGQGTLPLEVIEKNDNSITFKSMADYTHIGSWLTWNQMKVELIKHGTNQTMIKWTTDYQCDLGPRWYFEPLQSYAVGVMNEHLINTYFNE